MQTTQKSGVEHLRHVIERMNIIARTTPDDADTLTGHLKALYTDFFGANFDNFDVLKVRQAAPELLAGLQGAQQALRAAVAGWQQHGLMARPVQTALRNLFRVSRYAHDIVGEIAHGHPRLEDGETTAPGFTGPPGFLEISPAFADRPLDLEPGDVILERGMANNSAAIARIGDVDSQFSHVAVVAAGEHGEPVIVESLIEEGAVITPLKKALTHNLGRAVVLRYRDPYLARRASELIRDHIRRFDGDTAPRILYDFSMECRNYNELFCANLVRMAYSMATTADVQLPTFPTQLDAGSREFLDQIGVTAAETFAPGDMELESDFDVVAEWRDYRITSELRLKDMVMTKIFEWMELYGYRFQPDTKINIAANVGRFLSHMPDWVQEITRQWGGKVPPNMTDSAIAAVAMLHETGELLYERLKPLEEASIARHGRQLHPREVLLQLDRWREEMGDEIGYLRLPEATS
ncbi:MAG: YiiX/YebB-like N1pC/P60 family cysteine hydrolase [Hyphomicrobiaceae bacterium]